MGKPKLPKFKQLFPNPKNVFKGTVAKLKDVFKNPKNAIRNVLLEGSQLLKGDVGGALDTQRGITQLQINKAEEQAKKARSAEEAQRQAQRDAEEAAQRQAEPSRDQAGINARLLSDRLRRRRGVLANIYAGKERLG